ncbi:hypothetical protein Tco_0156598 [Tanacetum coccineum]
MEESLPTMVDDRVRKLTKTQDDLPIWLALKYKFERLHVATTPCRPSTVRPRDQDDPYDDAHPEGENNAKRQKSSEHGIFMFGESSSGQDFESEQGQSTSGNQEQLDDYDFWTDSYAPDDDEIPNEKVLQKLMDEMSHTVDEAKLRKVVDEMLRQRCTLGDEHQYHIDQMQSFLKNDIVWESRKEIMVTPHPQRPIPVVQSCQRDPKAHALSLVNQDLLTSRWVDKYVKKFNLYARYNVEHWKNPHAKIFYIKKQKDPGKPKEIIVVRRANGSIVSITESDNKNRNKNDIEDMYPLIVNHKVDDSAETGVKSYQQKVNFTAPTIIFSGIEKYKVFSIISEYGIIYKNNKKENRVMRHQEVHKFCDATLKRVLKGLKSYNNDVKHGYVTPSLSNKDVEYLQLFKEEIEERLKHRDQMRRWEMYVNRRPLGSRRERLE